MLSRSPADHRQFISSYINRSCNHGNLHWQVAEHLAPYIESGHMQFISSNYNKSEVKEQTDISRESHEQKKSSDENAASKHTFIALINAVRIFELSLDHMHEIGAYFVSDAGGRTFHVRRISQSGSLIIFEGMFDGHPIHLVKHHTQVNIALIALPKINTEPARIGFVAGD
jgi:hypothetical protein